LQGIRPKSAESKRVLRGGSWNNKPRNVRSSNRNNNAPSNRNNNLGFRLVNTGGFGCIRTRYGDPNRPCPCPGLIAGIPPLRDQIGPSVRGW